MIDPSLEGTFLRIMHFAEDSGNAMEKFMQTLIQPRDVGNLHSVDVLMIGLRLRIIIL